MQNLDPKAVWLFFLNSLFSRFILLISLGLVWLFSLIESTNMQYEGLSFGFLGWLGIATLVSLAWSWIWAKLTYRFYRYELKEGGFRKEHGVVWKKYVTIPYDRIQNVDIHRGIIARLLGLSDLQIQTAGGITVGSYGAFAEGRLPGLSLEVAEQLRDELIRRGRQPKNQGL
ncbi:MAG: PH domain-containing protein [Candidatus Terrybacteria bacterium]|nr:PH domain-containing protein [Candidatus Terrybacteria bacterium]